MKLSKAEIAKLPPLTIPRPIPPPSHRLQVIDLRKGSGPSMPKRDWVTNREEAFTRYVEASYPEARKGRFLGPFRAKNVILEGVYKWLAQGMAGMKVGGRRELVIPPKLVYPRWRPSWGYTPFVDVYVVDLLGMEPPPDRRVEYRHRKWHPCYASAASAQASRAGAATSMTKAEIAKLPPLRIPRPTGPPPGHFGIVDLRNGTGRVVGKSDTVSLRYLEDTYPQAVAGRQGALSGGEVRWSNSPLAEASRGIHAGVPGMRVGGRRELIVPPKVAYPSWRPSWGYAPFVSVYVVDVLASKPSD